MTATSKDFRRNQIDSLDAAYAAAEQLGHPLNRHLIDCLDASDFDAASVSAEYLSMQLPEDIHVQARCEEIRRHLGEAAEEMDIHDGEVLEEYFEQVSEWVQEHRTSSEDLDDYSYLMKECRRINDNLYRHLSKDKDLGCSHLSDKLRRQFADELAKDILDAGAFESEAVDRYACEGSLVLDGFDIGECEEQIEVSRICEDLADKLTAADPVDALEAWMGKQRWHCLSAWDLRKEHACVTLVHDTGMRCEYSLDAEQWEDLLTAVIIRWCELNDKACK